MATYHLINASSENRLNVNAAGDDVLAFSFSDLGPAESPTFNLTDTELGAYLNNERVLALRSGGGWTGGEAEIEGSTAAERRFCQDLLGHLMVLFAEQDARGDGSASGGVENDAGDPGLDD